MESNGNEADGGDCGPDEVTRWPDAWARENWIDNLNVRGYVAVLHCAEGSRRSSHYHLTDTHTLYVVSGEMHYWEEPVDGSGPRSSRVVGKGESVYTAPMYAHWTYFPEETVLVSVSKLHREHDRHEADLVRVDWFE